MHGEAHQIQGPDACKLFDTSLSRTLTFSEAFQFFPLVEYGKHHPVEKASDKDACQLLMRSAAKYPMNQKEFFSKPPEQISAFGVGLARNLQQALRYGLYGTRA